MTMLSVPAHRLPDDSPANANLMPLCGCSDGSIAAIVPVTESTYRTLFIIQQQIIDKDDHNACLNPRMHRALGTDVAALQVSSGKALLDYDVIGRYQSLPVDRKQLYARKVGKNGRQEVERNIQIIAEMLDYL